MSISELFKKNEHFVTLVGKTSKKNRVVETIRRIYGAIQSATFFWKKNHFFLKFIFLWLQMLWLFKKCRKKLWCSFFWGQNGPEKIFEFSEKSRKNRKKCVFFEKKLMVSAPFSSKVVSAFVVRKSSFLVRKKMSKKNDFHFLKLFF